MTVAVYTYGAVHCWSRIILRNHLKQWSLFTLAGGLTMAAGLGLYYIEVTRLDQDKLMMRPLNWPLVTLLGFGFNLLIFRRRRVSRRRSGKRWFVVAVVCTVCSNGLYVTLTYGLDVYYLTAQAIAAIIVGMIHYVLTHRKVFAEETRSA